MSAWLGFLDESGFLMAPLVRQTWSPRGNTPWLFQRTRHHRKVSAIAALCIPPTRDDVRLYFRLHADANIGAREVRAFLRDLHRHIDAPLVLLWDRSRTHRARLLRPFLAEHPDVIPCFFPPYAPELNPVEYLWGYLKMHPLANHTTYDLDDLTDATRLHARSVQRKPGLLRSFVQHAPLSLRLI